CSFLLRSSSSFFAGVRADNRETPNATRQASALPPSGVTSSPKRKPPARPVNVSSGLPADDEIGAASILCGNRTQRLKGGSRSCSRYSCSSKLAEKVTCEELK